MRAAPDGSGVWVFAFAPVIDPTEVRRSQGPRPSVEEMFDTFIYSVRPGPNGLTPVGTDQLDTLVRPLGEDDLPTTWLIRRTETECPGGKAAVLMTGAAKPFRRKPVSALLTDHRGDPTGCRVHPGVSNQRIGAQGKGGPAGWVFADVLDMGNPGDS